MTLWYAAASLVDVGAGDGKFGVGLPAEGDDRARALVLQLGDATVEVQLRRRPPARL